MATYKDPVEWGPHFWDMMKCVAANYSATPSYSEKMTTKQFYEGFKLLLPCDICKASYKLHLDQYPIDNYLDNKSQLVKWVEIIKSETDKSIKAQKIQKTLKTIVPAVANTRTATATRQPNPRPVVAAARSVVPNPRPPNPRPANTRPVANPRPVVSSQSTARHHTTNRSLPNVTVITTGCKSCASRFR